jgi:hypothetical protein
VSLLNLLGGLVKPVGDVIDSLHTSSEEKLEAKAKLIAIQAEFTAKALEYEAKIVSEQAAVIRSEAGAGFLAANWRPLTMLVFVGLVVAHWFGWSAPGMSEAEVLSVFGLIKIGLGGYVAGRTVEKIVPAAVQAFKSKEE